MAKKNRRSNGDLPQTFDPAIWWSCFNVTDKIIPGYSHVKFCTTRYDPREVAGADRKEWINADVTQLNYEHGPELIGGKPVIRVRKPWNSGQNSDVLATNSALNTSWFTGPAPILPRRYGICTRHWPARALVRCDPLDFNISPGHLLYPDDEDEWVLRGPGTSLDGPGYFFVCIMMDSTDHRSRRDLAVHDDVPPEVVVAWVEPRGYQVFIEEGG